VALTRLFLLVACAFAVSACGTTGRVGWYELQIEQGAALAVPYVRQTSRADCGMAALASVMAYYKGRAMSQQALPEAYPPASPPGYSLGELRDTARAHDFVAFVVPGDAAFLRRQLSRSRPLIVPLGRAMNSRFDHYVVVVGMDEERSTVITMDPARGPVELDFDDFAASWEKMNYAVLLVGPSGAPRSTRGPRA
jgi:ABC-type bacteriocin/lantibiotic exporter with double-glycine peptidase domain